MSDLQQPGIGDEHLNASAPLVRALLVTRLEQIWAACEPYIRGEDLNGVRLRPDPRFIEAGIRVLDRLADIYRLSRPVPPTPTALEGLGDPRELVLAALAELETRMGSEQG
jgi:hypothetical protein